MNEESTIMEKLDYLEGTKTSIRNAIIAKGQEVDEEDTFRSYAQKIAAIETGIDTSDATATAEDIKAGKTAYVDGEKIEGVLVPKKGDVKLFETIQNMNSDPTPEDDDIALVYNQILLPITQESSGNIFSFVDEILPEDLPEEYAYADFRAENSYEYRLSLYMSSEGNIDISYENNGSFERIEYQLIDNKYVRQGDISEVEFGAELSLSDSEWDNCLSKLCSVKTNNLTGLYQYGDYTDKNLIKVIETSDLTVTDTTSGYYAIITYNDSQLGRTINISKLLTMYKKIKPLLSQTINIYFVEINNNWCILDCSSLSKDLSGRQSITLDFGSNGKVDGVTDLSDNFSMVGQTPEPLYVYTLDLSNMTYTTSIINATMDLEGTEMVSWHYNCNVTGHTLRYTTNNNNWSYNSYYRWHNDNTYKMARIDGGLPNNIYYQGTGYHPLPSQLNLTENYQLLPGITALGKNSIQTGNEEIYDNLNEYDVTKYIANFDLTDEEIDNFYKTSKYKLYKNYTHLRSGNFVTSSNCNDVLSYKSNIEDLNYSGSTSSYWFPSQVTPFDNYYYGVHNNSGNGQDNDVVRFDPIAKKSEIINLDNEFPYNYSEAKFKKLLPTIDGIYILYNNSKSTAELHLYDYDTKTISLLGSISYNYSDVYPQTSNTFIRKTAEGKIIFGYSGVKINTWKWENNSITKIVDNVSIGWSSRDGGYSSSNINNQIGWVKSGTNYKLLDLLNGNNINMNQNDDATYGYNNLLMKGIQLENTNYIVFGFHRKTLSDSMKLCVYNISTRQVQDLGSYNLPETVGLSIAINDSVWPKVITFYSNKCLYKLNEDLTIEKISDAEILKDDEIVLIENNVNYYSSIKSAYKLEGNAEKLTIKTMYSNVTTSHLAYGILDIVNKPVFINEYVVPYSDFSFWNKDQNKIFLNDAEVSDAMVEAQIQAEDILD